MQERRFGTPYPRLGVERPACLPAASLRLTREPPASSVSTRFLSFMRTAAESWREGGNEGATGCTMRQAASVIFVRDGDNGLETILTYRPAPLRWAWSFPVVQLFPVMMRRPPGSAPAPNTGKNGSASRLNSGTPQRHGCHP